MRLVYTGTDGALYAWERAHPVTRLTWAWEEMVEGGDRAGLCYGWPTVSRDGRRILTLARRGRDRHFLYLVDVGGVVAEELVALGESAPIYANWSPDGTRIAMLVQRQETLALEPFPLPEPPGDGRGIKGVGVGLELITKIKFGLSHVHPNFRPFCSG